MWQQVPSGAWYPSFLLPIMTSGSLQWIASCLNIHSLDTHATETAHHKNVLIQCFNEVGISPLSFLQEQVIQSTFLHSYTLRCFINS